MLLALADGAVSVTALEPRERRSLERAQDASIGAHATRQNIIGCKFILSCSFCVRLQPNQKRPLSTVGGGRLPRSIGRPASSMGSILINSRFGPPRYPCVSFARSRNPNHRHDGLEENRSKAQSRP